MKLAVRIERADSSLMWYYFIRIEETVAKQFIVGDNRRVLCRFSDKIMSHSALMPSGNGGYYITVNQRVRAKLGLVAGQVLNIELEKDHSEYGMPMSDELREVLDQFEDGSIYFHKLTPGKQRTLIYWCDNVKRSDIKIRRAVVMVKHLIGQQGHIDFKMLNEEMKAANREANRT